MSCWDTNYMLQQLWLLTEHIERLRSLPDKDHRQLGYELGQRTNISAEDALRMLAKSISRISSSPLKCVQEMVKAVLDGKGVQGGALSLSEG